jgi:uncharacterized protein (DUF924 family)
MCGCDTADSAIRKGLSTDAVVGPLMGIWFMAGTNLDEFAQPFAPVIRELKAGTLIEPEWAALEGRIAKVLLGDQLSRSCFRGTPEAFEYDLFAREVVRGLAAPDQIEETLNEPAALLYLLPWAFAHSEEISDLMSAVDLVDKAIARYPDFSLFKGRNKSMIAHHRQVVSHFGHYPQRNKQYGRDSTPEEQAWLDDIDNLPLWAGGKWNCATPEWIAKIDALFTEGKPLPISQPKED